MCLWTKNGIVNSVCVDNWTVELSIIAGYEMLAIEVATKL